jgi:hypothetical protein
MMRRPRATLIVLAAALAGGAAQAQSPTPRPPLGPGRHNVYNMAPSDLRKMLPPPAVVDAGNVAISNFGTTALTFSYWDGESAWKTVQLNPGETTQVACAKCGETVAIGFHDGKQTRQVDASKGKHYALYWNAAQQAWDFKPQSDATVEATK